ncbi:hypothetical protein ACH5RR_006958 [Cinchona calisaya]|uniref:Uncharacterized protein n=1 Tax=Cinchona calisaya TaxID=153742 RepID=A0ABD3AQF0_9GENT
MNSKGEIAIGGKMNSRIKRCLRGEKGDKLRRSWDYHLVAVVVDVVETAIANRETMMTDGKEVLGLAMDL